MRILFLGVGKMGLPMASHLQQAGHALTVHDLDPQRLQLASAAGLQSMQNLQQALQQVDVVISSLPHDQALLIQHCSSVHTCFMRFAIDVVYLDKQMLIVKLDRNVPPWRMRWGGNDAQHTLEMSAGGIDRFKLHIGGTID